MSLDQKERQHYKKLFEPKVVEYKDLRIEGSIGEGQKILLVSVNCCYSVTELFAMDV